MFQPNFMVYLWMLPVLLMIVVPALWSIFIMLYKVIERSRFSDVRGFIDSTPSPNQDGNKERRHKSRIQIEGPKAVVARQVKCCQTDISNISSKGICLTNIPQKIFKEANGKFRVIFRSCERDYTMIVQPMWEKSGDSGYMVGAEILTIPVGWAAFVNKFSQPSLSNAA